MKDKIRTALRIAVYYDHQDICFGAYGCGPIFRNPTREVATMFKDILFFEDEFKGQFSNVVFAFEPGLSSLSSFSSNSSSSPGSSSGSSSSSSSLTQKTDMQIFKEVFDPAKLYNSSYKWHVSLLPPRTDCYPDLTKILQGHVVHGFVYEYYLYDWWQQVGLLDQGLGKGAWIGVSLGTRRWANIRRSGACTRSSAITGLPFGFIL